MSKPKELLKKYELESKDLALKINNVSLEIEREGDKSRKLQEKFDALEQKLTKEFKEAMDKANKETKERNKMMEMYHEQYRNLLQVKYLVDAKVDALKEATKSDLILDAS